MIEKQMICQGYICLHRKDIAGDYVYYDTRGENEYISMVLFIKIEDSTHMIRLYLKDEEKKILDEFLVCEIVFGKILDQIVLMKNYLIKDFQGKEIGTAYITEIRE
ncbi:hypothetical protein EXE30_01490 [Acinetobacter halotolerans]|uniref:Uncharacterized protein n=1 Tax=Acinetobacter halotolerans TaxID=1752076 RepID=A0A4Q6XMD1_9GAMM|nr:hypothetical protein [Acinetobacter halotolerans]RZF56955.1 hypothetical protein EXE30_01490 [Acinetobacter halotolerans]